MIDTHVNLHDRAFDADRPAVIARARAAGVDRMINVCDRLSNFAAVRTVAEADPSIWCTAGVHPHHAQEHVDLTSQQLCAIASDPKVVALGECGLDYHYDRSPRDAQRRVFAVHIAAARETGLPLVVHTRDADDDMLAMLEQAWPWGFAVLLHCYTSGAVLAARAAELGAWFSVSGIATFRAAEDVRERIRAMPADRILCETDCPYLAPAPLRGRRNEPAFLPHVIDKLGEIRGWSSSEARARVDAAAVAFFDLEPAAATA